MKQFWASTSVSRPASFLYFPESSTFQCLSCIWRATCDQKSVSSSSLILYFKTKNPLILQMLLLYWGKRRDEPLVSLVFSAYSFPVLILQFCCWDTRKKEDPHCLSHLLNCLLLWPDAISTHENWTRRGRRRETTGTSSLFMNLPEQSFISSHLLHNNDVHIIRSYRLWWANCLQYNKKHSERRMNIKRKHTRVMKCVCIHSRTIIKNMGNEFWT